MTSKKSFSDVVATVLHATSTHVLYEFKVADEAEPLIGYVPPSKVKVGPHFVPASAITEDSLSKFFAIGDELKCSPSMMDVPSVFKYQEKDGENGEVEITLHYVAEGAQIVAPKPEAVKLAALASGAETPESPKKKGKSDILKGIQEKIALAKLLKGKEKPKNELKNPKQKSRQNEDKQTVGQDSADGNKVEKETKFRANGNKDSKAQNSSDVYQAKIIQFKKPVGTTRVTHGVMEVIDGPYAGKRGYFQTKNAYVWGHHLKNADIMYNIKAGDLFFVKVTEKPVTSAVSDVNDIPLIIRQCWMGVVSEKPESEEDNIEFSSWLMERDLSQRKFRRWIDDLLPIKAYHPLPSDAYQAKVVSLIRESSKGDGAIVKVIEEGPMKDELVLFEREDFYVCGVAIGKADLRFVCRPGDIVTVECQPVSLREKQNKMKKCSKLEEHDFNHVALLAYVGSKRPTTPNLGVKAAGELRTFLEGNGLSVEEFEEMKSGTTGKAEKEQPKDKPSAGVIPKEFEQLSSIFSKLNSLTSKSGIRLESGDMEKLSKCSLIVMKILLAEKGKDASHDDVIASAEDVDLAIMMSNHLIEALRAKMRSKFEAQMKTALGSSLDTVLTSNSNQIQAATVALKSTVNDNQKVPDKPMSNAMLAAVQSTLQAEKKKMRDTMDPLAVLNQIESEAQTKKQSRDTDKRSKIAMDMKKRLDSFKAAKEQPLERKGRSDTRNDKEETRDRSERRRSRSPDNRDRKRAKIEHYFLNEKEMTPLELLRKYATFNLPMLLVKNHVEFRDVSHHVDTKTNFLVSANTPGIKEYYTVGCLYHFIMNMNLEHPEYVRKVLSTNLPVVRRTDRVNLLEYLTSKVDFVLNLDAVSHRDLNPVPFGTSEKTPSKDNYGLVSEYGGSVEYGSSSSFGRSSGLLDKYSQNREVNGKGGSAWGRTPQQERDIDLRANRSMDYKLQTQMKSGGLSSSTIDAYSQRESAKYYDYPNSKGANSFGSSANEGGASFMPPPKGVGLLPTPGFAQNASNSNDRFGQLTSGFGSFEPDHDLGVATGNRTDDFLRSGGDDFHRNTFENRPGRSDDVKSTPFGSSMDDLKWTASGPRAKESLLQRQSFGGFSSGFENRFNLRGDGVPVGGGQLMAVDSMRRMSFGDANDNANNNDYDNSSWRRREPNASSFGRFPRSQY